MLTIRQNLLETIKGGNPDRFVKQYEFMELIMEANMRKGVAPGEHLIPNDWGVYYSWPVGQLGGFPVHDEEHIVIKDIENWKEYVKAPEVIDDDESWAKAEAHAKAVDRNEKYCGVFVAPGLFEQCHHLMRMENALTAFYEYPDEMHELIDYLTEYELKLAEVLIRRVKPDLLFHHDDWGGQISTFLSPEMFEEFFLAPYKKIYGYYKDNGVELVVHHADNWAATLVPYMIEMGIDIWQGAMSTNNIPELIKQYGPQITFMGDLDSGKMDFPDWTPEIIREEVERSTRSCGKLYYIPCLTRGLGFSSFEGVYEKTNEEIDRMSKELF
ncbi:uroporphyrinogen decarboxylase [Alkalibacter rhizosphaerae]|uniref:Uroporphyrinogen decarboxylase n=1 Tax=Alkalibacter rhizosphaerae TaxID=2815577 RepID=A0A974XIK1_9FIRM|nr:uroporphyrinogen decarboxylase family protein [Alkalibacter rhizosphaerae]QSX09018.1 uroporphyrinogen decarboxylase [Alkalibacter rhizosphaerae]